MSEEPKSEPEDSGKVDNPNLESSDPAAELKEPSLGPACLVITILGLALICIVCGFGSWFMFRDQYPLAKKGITVQLIPWIETSQLSDEDKASITAQLEALIPKIEPDQMDTQQLTRLHNCLQDNPVFLWGGIELIQAEAANAGLTPTEQEALDRICDRLLRATAERKLGRTNLEFTIQNCSEVRPQAQSLDVVTPLTAEQIREFMERSEQILDGMEIPNEPYEKSASQVFQMMVNDALNPPPLPQ